MKYCSFIIHCLLLSSCVTAIELHKETDLNLLPPPVSEKKWEKTVPTFLFGLINASKTIKAWEKCPTNWHTIRITRSFPHLIISFLTLGLYTPSKVVIICDTQSDSTNKPSEFEEFNQNEDGKGTSEETKSTIKEFLNEEDF